MVLSDALSDHRFLHIVGTEELQIQILLGGQPIDASIRQIIKDKLKTRLSDEEMLFSRFAEAIWIFYPNGQFIFTPFISANVDNELYPIYGSYTTFGNVFELQGKRSDQTRTVSIDGVLYSQENSFCLTLIYIVTSIGRQEVAKIVQTLVIAEQPATGTKIEGVSVPSHFSITLQGTVDKQSFAGCTGMLDIYPCEHLADPNPFYVRLSTDLQEGIGRFLWWSFVGNWLTAGTSQRTISVRDGCVCITFAPAEHGLGLTWETQNRGQLADLIPTVGVDVQSGTLTFEVEGDRIQGEINAIGAVQDFTTTASDRATSRYQAQLVGYQQRHVIPLSAEDGIVTAKVDSNNLEESLDLPLSSTFTISIQGRTDAGSFEPRTGKLLLMPKLDSHDPNPVYVLLSVSGDYTNGWILWQSFDRGEPQSEIQVDGHHVSLRVLPSLQMRSLAWITFLPGDSPDSPVRVQVDRGTFTFSIEGDSFMGEIEASGTTLGNIIQPSFYQAQITGERLFSPIARELRTYLDCASFAHTWDSGVNGFGIVELQENEHNVRGTYAQPKSGSLEGIRSGERLDFRWQDSRGTGWGFVRALFNQDILAGCWGYGHDRTNCTPFIAIRQYPMLLTSELIAAQDAEELTDLGGQLWFQGRYRPAKEILEKVAEFYRQDRRHQVRLDLQGSLAKEAEVLIYLVNCDAQLRDYDSLLKHLEQALDIQRLQAPVALFQYQFKEQIAEVIQNTKVWLQQIDALRQNESHQSALMSGFKRFLTTIQADLNDFAVRLKKLERSQMLRQTDLDQSWIALSNFLQQEQNIWITATQHLFEQINTTFQHQSEPSELLSQVLQYFTYENVMSGSTTAMNQLTKLEQQIIQYITSHDGMTEAEKLLAKDQYNSLVLLLTSSISFQVSQSAATQLAEAKFFRKEVENRQQHSAELSSYFDRWRQSLATNVERIDALAKGQPFFQKLVHFLMELGNPKEALVACEKSKTRAFADLLAASTEMQQGIKEIYAKENILLNLTQAPAIGYAEITEMLREAHID